jgi:hypothetical protein
MALRLEEIERLHVGLLAAATVLALATAWVSAWSLLLGGAVMGGNFWLMRQLSRRLLAPGRSRRPAVVLAMLLAKFSLFMGLLGLLLWRAPIDPLGFGIGATMLLIACVAAALRQQVRTA